MVNDGIMNLLTGTWADINEATKGKKKMENKIKKYIVMSKFGHSDRFMIEKQFLNRHSADYYANLMKEEKEYDDMEYFLFEQTVAYNNKEDDYEDSIPF